MYKCEICSMEGDIHHIVHKHEGGLDFSLNYKCLCAEHHRGKNGPHRNKKVDIQYKLELQEKLEATLCNDFYTLEQLIELINLNRCKVKKILKDLKINKEGYKNEDIIFRLMGRKQYYEYMLEDYEDMMIVNFY